LKNIIISNGNTGEISLEYLKNLILNFNPNSNLNEKSKLISIIDQLISQNEQRNIDNIDNIDNINKNQKLNDDIY
jgi:hypothetical protein